MKNNMFDKKTKLTEAEKEKLDRKKTAQQWIPIEDIKGNIIYRKDGNIVAMLRIYPENLELLSANEKKKKIDSIAEVLNGQKTPMQIFCIGRPVDLTSHLEDLQSRVKQENDFEKKKLLKGFIQQAANTSVSGEITERRFYLIVNRRKENKAEQELLQQLSELKDGLSGTLKVESCDEDEIMKVFSLFASPMQAAIENNSLQYQIPSVLGGV